jgi:hypothetical protein
MLGIESVNPTNPFSEFHIIIDNGIYVLHNTLKQFNDAKCKLVNETIRGNMKTLSHFSINLLREFKFLFIGFFLS